MGHLDLETNLDFINIYFDKLIDEMEEIEELNNRLQKLCENKLFYLQKIKELNEKIVKSYI